jgi:tetratricopeptide (TPR) repeat protein
MIEASRDDPNLGRATFGFSAHALATVLRGQVLAEMGRLREAQATVDEAVGLARACDDVESLGWALGTYPLLAWLNGEPGDSLARARDSAEIAERLGSSFSRTAAHVGLAYAHNARAEWDEAGSAAERALEIAREARAAIQYEPQMCAALAEAKTGSRDYRAAVELAERAIGVARRRETRVFEVNAAIALARALRSLEGVAARDQFPSYSLTPPNSPASASVGTSSASARRAGRATEARRRPRRLRARASRGPAPV